MARKHHNRDSGVLVFDSRTNTVMADELNPENIKQKISAIREVVLNRSNNEIVLVLQYHDYDVDKAIASFMEDGAAQVLKEWNFTGKKSNNKKKKKKNKQQQSQAAQQPAPQTEAPKEDDTSSTEAQMEVSVNLDLVTTETAKSDDMHSPTSPSIESGIELDSVPNESAVDPVVLDSIPNGPVPVTHDPSSLPIGVPPSQDPVQPEASLSQGPEAAGVEGSADEGRNRRPNSPSRLSVSSDRVRTISESSNRSQASSHAAEKGAAGSTKRPASLDKGSSGKKPGAGLERSVKDLQRSTVSLQRYRNLLNEEIDASVKRIQTAFQELHQRLDDREVALMLELDHVKAHAIEILSKRQQQAVDLKVRTARAPTMTEAQLSELRADIKHFISDRKVDEEIGKTTRFVRDQHTMLNTIDTFGEVVPVKCVYSTRRPSLSSVSSINTTGSMSEPPTPTSPSRPFPPSPLATANQKDEVFDSLVTTASVTVTTAPGMSTAEMVELQHRLQENLRQQVRPMGISTASPERRRPQASGAPPQGPGRDRDRTNQNRDRASQGQQANRDRGVGQGKGHRNQDRTGQNQGRTGQSQNKNQDRANQDRTRQNWNRAGQNQTERTQDGQNRDRAGSKPGPNRAGSGGQQNRTEQKREGTELKQGGKGQTPETNKPTEPRHDQGQRQNRDRAKEGPKDRGSNSGQQGHREQGTGSPQRSGRNQRRRDRDRRDARRTNDSQDSANQSQDSGPKPSGHEKKPQSAAPPAGPSGDGKHVDNKPTKSGGGPSQSPSRPRTQHNQPRHQHQQKGGPKLNGSVERGVQNGPKENGPRVPEKDMNGPSVPSDALPQRKPKQRGGAQNKEQPKAIPNGVSAPEGTATTNGDWE